MKLKLMILSALFAAGVFASLALADGGRHGKKADRCHEVHISGTIAPQTLAVTVDRASARSLIPAGTQLNLAVGAAGQTVRVKAEACATGTGTSLVLTVKEVELKPQRVKTVTTGQTTTGTTQTATTQKRDDDDNGGDHKGKHHGTTTSTTTAATTTAATTTAHTTTTGTTTTTP
jgi:hypothetical protein